MTAQEQDTADRKKHIKEISDAIMAELDFATIMESGEMLVEDSGVYRVGAQGDLAEATIKREVELMEPEESNQFTREVVGHVERSSYVKGVEFDPDLDVLNLENGLYRLSSASLEGHSRAYLSRIQLPVRHDPKTAPVKIMRFLKEVLPNPDDLVNVLEDAASCLIRDARFQKGYMYIGGGANGKTTWFTVLGALLGKDNVTNDSIHDLAMSRFGAGNIEGKLAVINPDIAANEITLTGKLKAIISGDRITVERKGIQGHSITPFAKLFYAANTLPIVADDSDAWFRRWRITNWTVQIDAEKQNKNLAIELTDPKELSGLLNVLAAFARRLIRQGGFSYEASIHQTRAEWGNKSNVIKAFVTKCLNVQQDGGPELVAPSGDVYASYVKFCLAQKFTPKKQTGFMEEMKTVVPVRSEVRRFGSKTARILIGIELKEAPGLQSVTGVTGVTGSISRHTDAEGSIV